MLKKQVVWDLTVLFRDATDPSIGKVVTEILELTESFEQKYRGKISVLSARQLLDCLKELETIKLKISDISLYASLSFSAKMADPVTQALNDRVDKLEAKLGKQLTFFSLELSNLVKIIQI